MTAFTLREVLRLLLNTAYSNRRIARLLCLAPNTVRRYRTLLKQQNTSWSALKQMDDDTLNQRFNKVRALALNKRMPDLLYMDTLLEDPMQTRLHIWEDYCRAEPETAYSFSQFCEIYRLFKARRGWSMRQTHYPGDTCYVDYAGKTIPWTDTKAQCQRYAQIFVGLPGYSLLTFIRASNSQQTACFVAAHVAMFEYFGGVTKVVVPDNLKAAVIRAGASPHLNRDYQEMASHYNLVVEPARVRRPKDKSLVENAVKLVSRYITHVFRGRTFFSLDEINQALEEVMERMNSKAFRRMPGCRRSRFEQTERSALQPLPAERYCPAEWLPARKVPTDYHVLVFGHAYSVPYLLMGEKVEVRVTADTVELIHKGVRVATHARSSIEGGQSTQDSHRHPNHQEYAELCLPRFVQWAETVGSAALALVSAQFAGRPEHSAPAGNACKELQRLARAYGSERFELACRCACDIQSLTVKSVRSILQCKLDQRQEPAVPVQSQLPLHHNVRGADYFRGGL